MPWPEWAVYVLRESYRFDFTGIRLFQKGRLMPEPSERIIILGGGFGGLGVARRLDQRLPKDSGVEVLLVSRENFFSFTPMLHEVAASDVDLTHVVNPVRKLLRRVRFFVGDVDMVDLERRIVRVVHGSGGHRHHHDLDFGQLVFALGSTTNFYGLPGLAEHALPMKSLGDAIALRNHVIACLEEADTECSARAGRRAALATFVVAGGGFAGVETLAAINDFARDALVFYPNLRPADLRMVLVHSGSEILPELDSRLGAYARQKLLRRGIEIYLKTRVKSATEGLVVLSDDTEFETRTLVWTAGTTPHALLSTLPCGREAGRLSVNAKLQVEAWPGVWALGDCAWIPDPEGHPYPPTAQHAIRQGRVLADNVIAHMEGRPKRPFVFRTVGQLASIGRRAGVAQIFGLRFSGFFAWWLWRTIYLAKLPGLEKRLRVLIDWTLDLIFSKDLVQYATARSPVMLAEEVAKDVDSSRNTTRPRALSRYREETARSASQERP
ncbi:MAG: NAD(P)/FAD-dependent oxidoreductase [Polyangiales bacterium]